MQSTDSGVCLLLEDYVLRESGRYAHSPFAIKDLATKYGFSVLVSENSVLRAEGASQIMGSLFVLQKYSSNNEP